MKIDLTAIPTQPPKGYVKSETKAELRKLVEELDELQNLLYAEGKHAVLIIIQGLDASGKDGAIKNVFGTLNPQGLKVQSFKAPTREELSHDFLWRIHKHTPAKGMIHVFNRSHYEDILITRVHQMIDDTTAKKRIDAINDFEQLLLDNGTHILKFYLHVSQQEQHKRLQERIDDPRKHWKYDEADFKESKQWDNYMKAYADCFEHCNVVPWTVVPADENRYKEYVIAKALFELLSSLNMKYPELKKM
ncbi:PPK2 family polyphosphate kinase [Aridibaculum aurantiacum]|uniref:PPK2 family polyphosphate kinase n=1 Tax=Aridibaculum aurantiacum TaxID=2810307 RepID=UPI001A970C1F|nr:PPK2 family polyphosphate kinase [Aridibaculum aurantiacum]